VISCQPNCANVSELLLVAVIASVTISLTLDNVRPNWKLNASVPNSIVSLEEA